MTGATQGGWERHAQLEGEGGLWPLHVLRGLRRPAPPGGPDPRRGSAAVQRQQTSSPRIAQRPTAANSKIGAVKNQAQNLPIREWLRPDSPIEKHVPCFAKFLPFAESAQAHPAHFAPAALRWMPPLPPDAAAVFA